MAIITRLSRLVRADLHAVLDLVEEPDVLLRQALREMEEELAAAEQRVRRRQAEVGRIDVALQRVADTLEQTDGELDLCFESGKDELARSLVKRKLEAERRVRHLERKREELEKALAQDQAWLAENRERLESLRQQAELVAEDSGEPVEGPEDHLGGSEPVTRDDVEVAFLREQRRRQSK